MTSINNSKKGNTLVLPLLIVGELFFVIGFGIVISGFLTPFLKDALNLTVTQSYLVTAAIFSAFVIFGTPLTVRSSQVGAAFAGAKMFTAVEGNGDTFTPLTDELAADSIPQNYLYGMVNAGQLAAAIWTNSVGEKLDKLNYAK